MFTNDAYAPEKGQGRNLYVSQIVVNGRAISGSGTGSVLDYGCGATAFDGWNTTVGTGSLYSNGAMHIGLNGNDLLDGGAGADVMLGGYGNDRIQENDATAGNTDLALFDAGIAADQLRFRHVSNNLEVGSIGSADRFTLANWYLGNQYRVEQFRTSDGQSLLDSPVQNLVSAMAALAPPVMGETNLSAAYACQLAPVIAANWQ